MRTWPSWVPPSMLIWSPDCGLVLLGCFCFQLLYLSNWEGNSLLSKTRTFRLGTQPSEWTSAGTGSCWTGLLAWRLSAVVIPRCRQPWGERGGGKCPCLPLVVFIKYLLARFSDQNVSLTASGKAGLASRFILRQCKTEFLSDDRLVKE